MRVRVELRDTLDIYEEQPASLFVGYFHSVALSGAALVGDGKVVLRHEDGLGWAVPERGRMERPDPRAYVYSDVSIEFAP